MKKIMQHNQNNPDAFQEGGLCFGDCEVHDGGSDWLLVDLYRHTATYFFAEINKNLEGR